MPVQTKKSSFAAGIKKHADAPIDYGQDFIDLPGDIHEGRAVLSSIKKSVYKSGPNQGSEFLRLMGVVYSPKTAMDVKKIWKDGKVEIISTKEVNIDGQHTNIMIPLCETKKKDGTVIATQEENEAKAANELKKLGGENCLDHIEDDADLENLFAELVEQKIKFRFATRSKDPTKDYPNGGVWDHNWYGTKGIEDEVEDAPSEVKDSSPAPKAKKPAKEPEPVQDEGPDLKELAKAAGKGEQDAIDALTNLAVEAGYKENEVESAADWDEVVGMIENKGGEAKDADADEGVKIGGNYTWTHPDPKNKGKKLETLVEVTTINAKAETCTVKDVENGKPILDKSKKPIAIPLSELS